MLSMPVENREIIQVRSYVGTHADMKRFVRSAREWNSRNPTVVDVQAKLVALASNLGDWSKATVESVRAEIKNLKLQLYQLWNDSLMTGLSHVKLNGTLIELYLPEEHMRRH